MATNVSTIYSNPKTFNTEYINILLDAKSNFEWMSIRFDLPDTVYIKPTWLGISASLASYAATILKDGNVDQPESIDLYHIERIMQAARQAYGRLASLNDSQIFKIEYMRMSKYHHNVYTSIHNSRNQSYLIRLMPYGPIDTWAFTYESKIVLNDNALSSITELTSDWLSQSSDYTSLVRSMELLESGITIKY